MSTKQLISTHWQHFIWKLNSLTEVFQFSDDEVKSPPNACLRSDSKVSPGLDPNYENLGLGETFIHLGHEGFWQVGQRCSCRDSSLLRCQDYLMWSETDFSTMLSGNLYVQMTLTWHKTIQTTILPWSAKEQMDAQWFVKTEASMMTVTINAMTAAKLGWQF